MGTYIVTGASSGIGRETALLLAARGNRVIALGRSKERLDALAAGDRLIVPLPLDLTDAAAIAQLSEAIGEQEIDGLINNAAIQVNCRFDAEGYGMTSIASEIATNLTAPILLTHLLARRARSAPLTVVNVNSGLALFPKSTSAVYSASKAGLRMFGTAISAQSGSKLRIVDVILPLVDTDMTAGRGAHKIAPEVAATAVVSALDGRQREVFVGRARLLKLLLRVAPSLAARIMRRM